MAPEVDAILKFNLEKVGPTFFKFVYAQKRCAEGDTAALNVIVVVTNNKLT
jgi:hypothetical protein